MLVFIYKMIYSELHLFEPSFNQYSVKITQQSGLLLANEIQYTYE